MFTKENLLVLADRLRRQSLDVVVPVLALIAAGQVGGVDFASVATVLIGSSLVTVLTWLVALNPRNVWERLVITLGASLVGVIGTDWNGWLDLDVRATVIAVAGAFVLSLLRTWTTRVE